MSHKLYIGLIACLAGFACEIDRAAGSDFNLAETAGTMRIWHQSNGLPSDSVTAIVQTQDGFLWVGTAGGLVRFDGVNFTEIKLPVVSTNEPVRVTALCEDSNASLWVGTERNGLFRMVHGRIQQFTTKSGLLDDGVTSLAADKLGKVWVGTQSGLDAWTGTSFKAFTMRDGLPDKSVAGVNVARSGTVWITTRAGMSRYLDGHITPYAFQTESQGRSPEYLGAYEDRQGNLWAFGDTYLINLAEGKRFNYFRSSDSASLRIWSLCEGSNGRLWIGTSGRGLFCFEDNSFQPVIIGENRWSDDVRAIYEDHDGNLWLGTSGGGLMQLRPQSLHVLRVEQGLPAGAPSALALDAKGKIYVAMQRAGLFARESEGFDRVGGGGLMIQSFITALWAAPDRTLWAGTLGDGLYGLKEGHKVHFTTANGLADNTLLSVCADAEGAVWFSTSAGTVHRLNGDQITRFDEAQGSSGSPVTVMIPAAAGGLWLGTQDGQILRETKGKFSSVSTPKRLEKYPVIALQEAGPDRLWIGTFGGGLACLSKGLMVSWTTHDGLPANTIAGVVEDPGKNLWLATELGIYRVAHGELLKTLADPQLPLPCSWMSDAKSAPSSLTGCGSTRTLLSPDGELWFAAADGVLNVDTRQSETASPLFHVFVESAAFNGQPPVTLLRGGIWASVEAGKKPYQAPVDTRSLEVRFSALSFAAPENIRVRHKLEGFDSDWVAGSDARSVRYGRLPYGAYRFRIAARNVGGDWQETTEPFVFEVPAPIYLQTWAIALYVFAAIALVTGIVRIVSHRRLRFTLARLEQQQSLERERMRIARDMHDEMGSKLTKISFLSEHAQVDANSSGPLAQKLESIAHTSRDLLKTMDEIVWVVNPRNDTLENLTTYLSHYAVEYFENTSIECELRLPELALKYPLSSEMRHNLFLTFEEALNNVLKHSGATRVKVEMSVAAHIFEIRISDNGCGLKPPPKQDPGAPTRTGRGGNGLKNMRQRLSGLGGECFVFSETSGGTTVILRIRLHKKAGKEL